jgi:hypothetical protein
MRNDELPVTVSVTREDGSVEQVQVGTAVRRGEGFSIRLFELTVGAGGEPVRAGGPPRRAPAAPGEPPTVFPPYGRSKGQPIKGASAQDLEFYATGARRTLADPGKARFHDKERALLVAIEAEQARQGGGGGGEPPAPDDDAAF